MRVRRALAALALLAASAGLLWAAFPGVPGRLLVNTLAARLPFPLAAHEPKVHPNLDVAARRLATGFGAWRASLENVSLDPELRRLLQGRALALVDVEGISLDGMIGDGAAAFPAALRFGRVMGEVEAAPRPRARLRVAALGGEVALEAASLPGGRTVECALEGADLDLDLLWPMIPLAPNRVRAKVRRFHAKGAAGPRVLVGGARLELGPGTFETLVSTSPVLLDPTGFGEIPSQLGLTNDRSSCFASITAEAEARAGGAFSLRIGIASPHYRLDADGTLDPAGVLDGRLTLALPPETLAGNALGIDFRGRTFRIYGTFRGPPDDVQAVWDLDKEALLRGAADLLRDRMKGWLRLNGR